MEHFTWSNIIIILFFQNKLKTLASELGRGNAWFQLIARTGGVNYFCSILRTPVRNHPAAYWTPKQGQFGRAQISINSLPDRPLRFPNLRLVIVCWSRIKNGNCLHHLLEHCLCSLRVSASAHRNRLRAFGSGVRNSEIVRVQLQCLTKWCRHPSQEQRIPLSSFKASEFNEIIPFYVMFANAGFLFTELRCFSKSRKPNISNIAGVSNLVGNPWRGLHFN